MLKYNLKSVSYETWIKGAFSVLLGLFALAISFGRQHVFSSIPVPVFGKTDFMNISIYGFDLVFAIVLAFYFLNYSFHKKQSSKLLNNSVFLCLILWLLILIVPRGLLSSTWNYWFLARILESIAIFLILSTSNIYESVFFGFSIGGAIQAIIAIAQFWLQRSIGLKFLGEPVINIFINGVAKIDVFGGKVLRAYGTFSHPNQLGAFLIVSCATSFYLFLTKDKAQKKLAAIFLGLSVIGEVLTFSRAGIATMFVELLIIFYFGHKQFQSEEKYKDIKIKLFQAFKIIFVSLFLVCLAILPEIKSRVNFNDSAISDRVYYNGLGLQIFKQNPLFGIGAGNIIPAIAKALPLNAYPWQVQPPHNYFLIVACETGIVGLALIIYLFLKIVFDLYRQITTVKPLEIEPETGDSNQHVEKFILFAILISFLILMQFDHYFYTLPQTQLLLWIVLGMICGAIYKKEPV